jgi:type II secretory pathway component GspD/PulD (secretin)
VAALLTTAVSESIVGTTGTTTTPGVTTPAGLGTGAVPGLGTGAPGTAGAAGTAAAAAARPVATSGTGTKSTTLRFVTPPQRPGQPPLVSTAGLLEDVHVTSYSRINALIISAPEESMELILNLIHAMDVAPTAQAIIRVYTLKNADANTIATTLEQVFLGTTTTTGAAAAPGGFGGAGGTLTAPTATAQSGLPRALFTLGGFSDQGAPLVPISIGVDTRTNSVIVAGSPNDVIVTDTLIDRLDNGPALIRRSEVFHLRNASAADVATAVQNFVTQSLTAMQNAQTLTAHDIQIRDVVVVPEPITNQLLISVVPEYYPEVLRVIQQLDEPPPQVLIQVMIAEVDLTSDEEFGVELGFQSPVLFRRGITPDPSAIGSAGSISYTNATGGLVPPGVTVNSSINPTAQPGFLFGNPSLSLGNNPLVSPGQVGFQGLTNLGVGRTNSAGLGGFVFSASSNAVSVLVRALKTQGRMDILTQPIIQALDNQTANLSVGQNVPYVNGSTLTATGLINNSVLYKDVGVLLTVTPKISPDGTIIMRVTPEVSSIAATAIQIANGQTATAFNVQHFDTTVFARDGETVVIGGLITKNTNKTENKVPWLGDLPYIGTLFRYRVQTKTKNELLVIMTPHIVRSAADQVTVLQQETARMDWILSDVIRQHGPAGLEPILPPPPPGQAGGGPQCVPGELLPGPATLLPQITPAPAPAETLPQPYRAAPQVVPPPMPKGTAPQMVPPPMPKGAAPQQQSQAVPDNGPGQPGTFIQVPPDQVSSTPLPPAEPAKENRRWNVFQRNQ